MKVLHLLKTEIGAAWAYRQICVLRRLGIEVTVVLPTDKCEAAERYRMIGVEVIPAIIDFPAIRPWKILHRLKDMRKLVQEVKPDIIHSHFVGITYIMRLALGKNHSIPRIFQVPGPLHLEHGPFGTIDKALAGERDFWVGSCEWTCRRYIELGIPKEKVFKAFYGTEIIKLKNNPKGKLRQEIKIAEETPLVGMIAYMYPPKRYLGQLVGLKGHEDFIKSIALVKRKIPNIKAVIIGGPWGKATKYENNLKKMARDFCGDSIIFTGFRKDVPEVYPDLDVVAHPSLSENLGGAAESLLAGVPTVATNVGGFPDIVIDGETGWLVPPKNPEQLSATILEVLNNREEAQRRAKLGQNLTTQILDVNNTAKDIAEIYNKILSQKIIPN